MIELRTLGGLEIQRVGSDGLAALPSQGKRSALLAYLAVERPLGESHARDTLLGTFWPDSDDRRARDALKQLTRSMRRDFGENLLVRERGNGIALDPAEISCDVTALIEAAERDDHDRVLELYRGDFLAGFHLTGSVPFEEWLTRQHLRLRNTAVASAEALAEGHEADGDVSAALGAARRIVELRPFGESGLRTLVRLYLDAGEPGQAVEAFDAYEGRLRSELGASPSVETVALVEQARTEVVVRSRPDVVTIEAPPPRPSPWVRERHQDVASPEGWWGGRGAVGAVVATFVIAGGIALAGLLQPAQPALDKARVVVADFDNLSGDPTLEYLGRQAADEVAGGLATLEFLDVRRQGPTNLGEGMARSSSAAGALVQGSILPAGRDLKFEASLVDFESGTVMAALPTVEFARGEDERSFAQLRDYAMAAAGAYADPRVVRWLAGASWPRTLEAYRLFAEGIDIHTTVGRYAQTKTLFLGAYEADTTFTMAALWAGLAAENMQEQRFADSLYTALRARRADMPRVDAHYLEYLAAPSAHSQLTPLRRLVELAPESGYRGLAAGSAFRSQRPEETLAFSGRDPVGSLAASALEALGRCEEILPVADRSEEVAQSVYDRQISVSMMRLLAYACSGDAERFLSAARDHVARLAGAGLTGQRQRRTLALPVQGLLAHSDAPSAADPAVDYVAGLLEEVVGEDLLVVAVLAELLASAGRTEAAAVLLREAMNGDRERVYWKEPWLLAMLEAREGLDERVNDLLARSLELWRQQDGRGRDVCSLCVGVVRAHQGDLEAAISHLARADFTGWEWWEAHHRPFVYGPLRGHPLFERLIAPRG